MRPKVNVVSLRYSDLAQGDPARSTGEQDLHTDRAILTAIAAWVVVGSGAASGCTSNGSLVRVVPAERAW